MDGNGVRLSILESLHAWCLTLPSSVKSVLLGYSGGRDSHVLLHALAKLNPMKPDLSIRAIHINHGLLPHAEQWAQHCQTVCDNLSIPLTIRSLGLTPIVGESVENLARQARYSVFSECLAADEVLLTAHHLEDQAETVLLQLLRGSGPKGLSGMASLRKFYTGWHGRPLLEISRTMINDYANMHGLNWIEDDSNEDLRFSRNFIRHKIASDLATLNPSYASCLARSAKHCADAQALLDGYLSEDLARCETPRGLSVVELGKLSVLRQHGIFRLWLQNGGYPLPSTKKLRELLDQMTHAKLDSKPCVEWGEWQVKRIKGEIVLGKREKWTV